MREACLSSPSLPISLMLQARQVSRKGGECLCDTYCIRSMNNNKGGSEAALSQQQQPPSQLISAAIGASNYYHRSIERSIDGWHASHQSTELASRLQYGWLLQRRGCFLLKKLLPHIAMSSIQNYDTELIGS